MSLLKLPGIGKQIAKHLTRLKIHTIQDLLFHWPLRYQDRTQIHSIRTLIPGQEAVVEGVLQRVSTNERGRTKCLCELKDESGRIFLRFFHVMSFQLDRLKLGARLRCYSEVRLGPKGLEMIHPEFQVIMPGKEPDIEQHLTPIYPSTEGLSQYVLRKITQSALLAPEKLPELIPSALLSSSSLSSTLKQALHDIHRPSQNIPMDELTDHKTKAQKRIIFEELVAHRLSLLHVKQTFQTQTSIPLFKQDQLIPTFLERLPFKLTDAQKRVSAEIQNDLKRDYPMLRLLQGDVGSGKTVVAALALLCAVENHRQAALMAPTELLAEQHYQVFERWFKPLGISVRFLSSNTKAKNRNEALESIANGESQVIIGTHALFQSDVNFKKLALIIIDEQHRFGVEQRALLREKGIEQHHPHQLMMTATPIPRTLTMSFYADLDCSIIDEVPPGRTPIETRILANDRRDELIARIRDACCSGRQVYWVCPLIDESESITAESAIKTAEYLQKQLPGLSIALIHGRMKANEKEAAMRTFQQGKSHLLVATTIIEVGVDVPNASVMIIENAERLGLSQLHQLRGRVGRGRTASHCVMLYQAPLSALAKERLSVMRETTDGFKIAERDLALRGPGEVFGTRQTGELSFRIANLMRDSYLFPAIQKTADDILKNHPDLIDALIDRWIGIGKQYAEV